MSTVTQTIRVRASEALFCVLSEELEVFGPFQTWEEAEDFLAEEEGQFIIKEITTPATVEFL